MLEELRGKFILSRAKHLRIERADGTLKSRLRGLISNMRNRAIGTVAGLGIVTLASAFAPTTAMAAENGMVDTSNPITNEQTVTPVSSVEETAPVVSEPVAPVSNVVETAPVVSEPAAPVSNVVESEQVVSEPVAPVSNIVETEPVVSEPVAPVSNVVETAPVVSEPAAPVSNVVETEPVVNEQTEPVSSVEETEPAIDTEQSDLASELDTTTSVNEETNEVTAPETETSEISNEQIENVTTGSDLEEENTNSVETSESTVNDMNSDELIGEVVEEPLVGDNTTSEDVQTSEDVTTSTTEDNMDNTTENDTLDESVQVNDDKHILENNENGYQVFEQNGQTYVVGNITDEQLTQIVNEYGSVVAFDQNEIDPELGNGESINLGNSGYTATKDENGYVTVTDENGNLITSWDASKENSQDNQQTNEDSVSDFEVNPDEFLLIKNEDGSYTIAQGGVGLSHDQFQELVDELKQDGKLPEDAVIVTDILPPAPTDEMIANGQTEQSATIGDYVFSTSDGKNYQVYDKDGNLVTTISSDDYENIKDEQLGENQDMSNDPDAEPDAKPTQDEPTPDEPTPDEPTPDEPTPDEPTPDEPTPDEPTPDEPTPDEPTPDEPTPDEPTPDEPTPDQPTPDEPTPEITYTPNKQTTLPTTGDASAAIAVGTGIAGAALAGAGVALRKRDDKKETKRNKNLTLIEGGKGKTTYEDLQKMYDEGVLINPHDYDDDLELFAQAYVLSQKQNEKMQTNPKGRIR